MITSSTTLTTFFNSTQPLFIGVSPGSGFFYAGNIDELRFSIDRARYASNAGCIVATAPFPGSLAKMTKVHDGRTGQGHPARLDSRDRRLACRQGFHQFGNLGLVVRWTCHYRSDSVVLVQEQAAHG